MDAQKLLILAREAYELGMTLDKLFCRIWTQQEYPCPHVPPCDKETDNPVKWPMNWGYAIQLSEMRIQAARRFIRRQEKYWKAREERNGNANH